MEKRTIEGTKDDRVPQVSEELKEIYNPLLLSAESGLIYHYCSVETLLAILKFKTIRFGESSKMNDGEEIKWAKNLMADTLKRLHDRDDLPDGVPALPKKFLDKIETKFDYHDQITKHFFACFSEAGDSLSQWRAYADDARGFSIGFDPACIDIPASLMQIEYDPEIQSEYLIKAISKVYELSKKEDYNDARLNVDVLQIYAKSAFFKNPAFADEKEIRSHHLAGFWRTNKEDHRGIHVPGGYVDGKDAGAGQVEFRAHNGHLVPFIDFNFQLDSECAIKEIWLGPRNPNDEMDVEAMLGTLGYREVSIKRAGSAYRG